MTTSPVDSTVSQRAGLSEFGVAGLLAALGVIVLYEASHISKTLTNSNPLGPKTVPISVGLLLLVVAVLLALDIARGGRGDAEESEDADLSLGTDWRTLLSLVALFAAVGQLIPIIGFPASGVILFFGVARLLGSRKLWLDVLVSIAVPLTAFLIFTRGLGVYLPAGPN